MTTTSIVATTNDQIRGRDATYATARSTSNLWQADTMYLGQLRASGPDYWIRRLFLKFNTSSIPDDDVISQVNLKLVCLTDASTLNDFDVQIIEQNWSGTDPISDANRETPYDNCLAASSSILWRNTNGMSINTEYTSNNLTTSYVNKTGYTYYSLRSSRDYGNNAPATDGNEYIEFAKKDHATPAYRPTLIVVHAPVWIPKVIWM